MDAQGRVVTALGKHWCVEHFVCAKCEKPFLGNRHYERKGLAYCETHYHQLFGDLCYISNQVSVFKFLCSLMFTGCREGAYQRLLLVESLHDIQGHQQFLTFSRCLWEPLNDCK